MSQKSNRIWLTFILFVIPACLESFFNEVAAGRKGKKKDSEQVGMTKNGGFL